MFLEKMAALKREEVGRRKSARAQKEMAAAVRDLAAPRDFLKAFDPRGSIALIAEIKRASPSAGAIRMECDIGKSAAQYEAGGARAISVLTEKIFFKGELAHIGEAKGKVALPVLQKDFILDPFQLYEGCAAGADAVLLIAALLSRNELKELSALAGQLRMTPLVEVHDERDLEKTSGLALPLLGINNRDLKSLKVDLETTLRLKKSIPPGVLVISESGVKSSGDVRLLRGAGIDGVLVGETLMRSADPAGTIRELLAS